MFFQTKLLCLIFCTAVTAVSLALGEKQLSELNKRGITIGDNQTVVGNVTCGLFCDGIEIVDNGSVDDKTNGSVDDKTNDKDSDKTTEATVIRKRKTTRRPSISNVPNDYEAASSIGGRVAQRHRVKQQSKDSSDSDSNSSEK